MRCILHHFPLIVTEPFTLEKYLLFRKTAAWPKLFSWKLKTKTFSLWAQTPQDCCVVHCQCRGGRSIDEKKISPGAVVVAYNCCYNLLFYICGHQCHVSWCYIILCLPSTLVSISDDFISVYILFVFSSLVL